MFRMYELFFRFADYEHHNVSIIHVISPLSTNSTISYKLSYI